ncbi:NAD(P)-dependent alcohol dehydrogenase [Priestia filamentosa]|uniref:NAD(P)-dependent alcohol dehydrogenase n=1 Tax=Priestia filamentosa TaxID=1402861 RepID=UPI0003193E46|nr:NAD(P)-dependent alcohol dehydrogenase [Priestia filamentosa]OXS65270.1 alcohol dehydrogenase [Priestia filamentosa]RJS62897.1 NAD(P)-dependent alcohol dehydrogenase [Priestia filamentosa]SMF69944.1 NADPH:quinone reductase [Priestia filamentosa]
MKAIVCNKYGSPDVLELKKIKKPLPTENEILVKVHSASLNFGNLVLLKGKPFLARFAFGLTRPRYSIPGGDIAGKVEAVGKEVKLFQVGDEVFGDLSGCGWGGFAEYVTVPEHALALKPANISFEEAAATPMAGVTALQGLRDKGKIKSGQKVLIYGASGGVGTFAVQIAKSFGVEVTGVCSTRNLEILHSIGADHIIDYTKEDFTKNEKCYDLILGVNGSNSISAYKRVLKPNGNFVHVGGSESQLFQALVLGPFISMTGSKKISNLLQRANQKDLNYIKELLDNGKVKPIIDKRYKLNEVTEAFKYFQEGHAQGKVVITL